ncbi:unnamed protein product [Kuraishia capsulata CBS 1993]|uniref:KOW domain-containing protein n=1 Tax=Kuraishia capsulata CBS 1993 TaxID=1382522 RepID=W6MFS2_9ASCO|nr:uncharacterized protein KUCA_T00000715001 [Kuraishia capsulata CBS 1993]CDK24749.1 unnamed protein product [Kuraishia capsulata CBS 1993]
MSSKVAKAGRYAANFERLGYRASAFQNMFQKGQLPFLRDGREPLPEAKQNQTMEDWKFVVGDRVLLTSGPNKGTVTSILSLQKSNNSYFLEHGQTKKASIPFLLWERQQESYLVDYPVPVTADSFKLVTTIKEEDGTERDVAADDIVYRGKYYDSDYNKMLPYRCIKNHEHIIIPWPRPDPITDDGLCTPQETVLERTFFPDSLVSCDVSKEAYLSLRDPLAKRPYKWDRKVITKSDLKRLTPPKMPFSETKKAFFKERADIRAKQIKEISPEVEEFIGKKVADYFSKIQDPDMRYYLSKMAGDQKKKGKKSDN